MMTIFRENPQGEFDFSVLLGSSQIIMLKKVRETPAGRLFG